MNIEVTRATDWAAIEAAAATEGVTTCIRPEGPNWRRAKETWDLHSGGEPDVIYFTVYIPYTASPVKGYIRFLRVSTTRSLPPTWVVDFVRPSQYGVVIMAAAQVPGAVLVKKFGADDDTFVRCWPTVTLAFPKLDQYPYHAQYGTECEWLVVPKLQPQPT